MKNLQKIALSTSALSLFLASLIFINLATNNGIFREEYPDSIFNLMLLLSPLTFLLNIVAFVQNIVSKEPVKAKINIWLGLGALLGIITFPLFFGTLLVGFFFNSPF